MIKKILKKLYMLLTSFSPEKYSADHEEYLEEEKNN